MTNPAQDLRSALEWYGEQARLARLIHSEGDVGRHALQDDGGKLAEKVLALAAPATDEPVAWLYVRKDGKDRQVFTCQWRALSGPDWTETPLYAHPPAAEPKQSVLREGDMAEAQSALNAMQHAAKPVGLLEAKALIANLAAVVRIQNGNRHEDINALLASADTFLATPARTDDAGVGGEVTFPHHSHVLAARMGGRLVPRDDIATVIGSARTKYEKAARDVDLGRKERTRCSHYVQVLDEIYAALHQGGSGE